MTTPLYALTLWRPWPYAFFYLPPEDLKDLENRPWKPPERFLGQRIMLHAGKHWDDDRADLIPGARTDARARSEGLIGSVRLLGWVADDGRSVGVTPERARELRASRWYFGPYAWICGEPRALRMPIPCRGAQGLWPVPELVFDQVLEQGHFL
jgi:hypothetical protein